MADRRRLAISRTFGKDGNNRGVCMAKTMKRITVILVVLSAVLGMLDSLYDSEIWLALMITSSTTAYHFAMRLFVGYFINRKMKNKADYNRRWYRVGAFEMKFYDLI